jgi:hypothetical protein
MKAGRDEAVQVFRQFAWALAGKLATPKPAARPKPRPSR